MWWKLEQPKGSLLEGHLLFQALLRLLQKLKVKITRVSTSLCWFGADTVKPLWVYSSILPHLKVITWPQQHHIYTVYTTSPLRCPRNCQTNAILIFLSGNGHLHHVYHLAKIGRTLFGVHYLCSSVPMVFCIQVYSCVKAFLFVKGFIVPFQLERGSLSRYSNATKP